MKGKLILDPQYHMKKNSFSLRCQSKLLAIIWRSLWGWTPWTSCHDCEEALKIYNWMLSMMASEM